MDVAPDFSAVSQEGKVIRLSDFRGKPVLLYFYPKDDTPGCTQEACTIRDRYAEFQKAGIVVLGISAQDEKSHKKFREKYQLPFDLLVDRDGEVAKKFGVSRIPLLGFHRRQSVLIGPDGKVRKFFDKVEPQQHAAEVLEEMKR